MDANSSKPAQTCIAQVESLRLTHAWLDRAGGGQRIPRALQQLVESTETALARGDMPPEKDTTSLRDILQHLEGGRPDEHPKPLRAVELGNWWASRHEQLKQVCRQQGCLWVPRLVVKTGGGRGLPSRLSLELVPTEGMGTDEEQESREGATTGAIVRYQMDPAKPALWLRLLVGSRPFPIQSWRGYVLLGSAVVNMLLIGLLWLALYASWREGRPLDSSSWAQLGIAAVITAGLWWQTKPLRELPTHRVTLAGPTFLAMSELYGQLRTMKPSSGRLESREFAVVRHWGICPICSAEVDLDAGGKAFPDRLVGRCHDAPREHVFSFDPVRLIGKPLMDVERSVDGSVG